MSDARWVEVFDDLGNAVAHFSRSVEIFERGGFDGNELAPYMARMALMQSMQSGYTSLETAFERILEIFGEEKPAGANYHADLVRRVSRAMPGRPAIIDAELFAAVDDARRFRHVARRSYDAFRVEGAETAIRSAALISDRIVATVDAFRRLVDG